MTIAQGIAKRLAYKVEDTWGVVTTPTTGGQYLRRVTSDINLTKDAYQSNELRTDYQVADYRHGVRRVGGNINGEFSLGTYKDFLAAAFRKAWVTGSTFTSGTGTEITTTTTTIVRAGGSWITDGFKVGDVVRMTGHSTTANNSKNFRVASLSATVMTIAGTAPLTADAVPDATCTVAVTGSKLWVPTTGHTDQSFSIEHNYTDLDESEVFSGCKVNTIGLSLPPTGMMTVQLGMTGKDMTALTGASAPYFTSAAAETTSGILAAVNGTLRIGGTDVAVVTGLSLNIESNYTSEPVVGSNTVPGIIPGRVRASGQFTAFYESGTLRDDFINETEIQLVANIEAAGTDPKDVLVINLPRIKFGGATKDDGEKGLVQTIPFTCLLRTDGADTTAAHLKTTISLQDTSF